MDKHADSKKHVLKTKIDFQRTVADLERQRKTYNTINLSVLPDRGAKLKQNIAKLEDELKNLTRQLEECCINQKNTEEKREKRATLDSFVENKDEGIKKNVNIEVSSLVKNKDDDLKINVKIQVENKDHDLKKNVNIQDSTQVENVNANSNDSGYNERSETKEFTFGTPCKDMTSFQELSKKVIKDSSNELSNIVDSPSFKTYRETKAIPSIKLIEPKPMHDVNSYKRCQQNLFQSSNLKLINNETVMRLQNSLSVYPEDSEEEDQPKLLKASLMHHQIKALSWMVWRESQLPSGGILADDMGLGKTLTMISLILKQKEKNNYADISNEKSTLNISKGTLIVCLASILHQWANEITKHCKENALTMLIYHGPKRERDIDYMRCRDVVLTTYDILVSEKKTAEKSGLFNLKFERIILDEAHTIKNSSTKKAEAVFNLKCFKKWCVTGTPIHNDFKDMYSLIKFLQFNPFDDYEKFKKLTDNDERRNLLVKSILLRRTKSDMDESGKPLIEMKAKSVIIRKIELSLEERKVYDELHNKVYNIVHKFLHEPRKRFQNSSALLVLLLRLQQCCSHTSLLKEAVEETVDNSLNDVSTCLSSLTLDDPSNSESGSDSLLNVSFSEYENFKISDKALKSTKIKTLFEELNKISSESNGCAKSVIVSQWVSMLDLVAFHLDQERKPFYKIVGSTKPEDRQKVSEDFNYNSEGHKIMLLSLKAGGVGLNLIGANHLFLLDLHWNPALEMQACDRIHRVGQKSDVFIHKFVCKGTIEETILSKQQEKSNLACNVYHGAGKAKTGLSMEDFKELFNVRL